MSDELRTNFTTDERETIVRQLRDEYGDREFSEELILLECQDLWRKGCHNLEHCDDCRGCGKTGYDVGSNCSLIFWEKRHPEYKDDEIAKRLKALRDELRGIQSKEIEKSLLSKGYVKVQWKQWNDDELIKSDVKLYQPGSKDLKADIAEAVENWKNMWGKDFVLKHIDLNAKSGTLLDLRIYGNDDEAYEIWEIIE